MSRDPIDGALDALGRAPPPPPPPPGEALTRALGAMRPVATRSPGASFARVALASIAYGAALVVALRPRADAHSLPAWWLAAFGAAWLVGFVATLAFALLPRRGQVAPEAGRARIAIAAVSLTFIAAGLAFARAAPGSIDSTASAWAFARHAWPCLVVAVMASTLPAFLAARAVRRAVPSGARWVAAAAGAAGGALGGLVLHAHCHVADGMHVGLVHGGAVLLTAALAAWLGGRTVES